MKIITDSHLDHGLTEAQIDYIKERYADRDAFFIDSFELPAELGWVPCGLYGPLMGDKPITDISGMEPPEERSEVTYSGQVFYMARGKREHESRLIDMPMRPSRTVTVIAGPHEDEPCVLFTAFGGPLAPKEPEDTEHGSDERGQSEEFWAQHALAADDEQREAWIDSLVHIAERKAEGD